MNEVMTEFDSGASGARKLLEEVRARTRGRPPQLSDEVIKAYRDSVQATVDRLKTTHPDKDISVMLDRLEIYRIWMGQ